MGELIHSVWAGLPHGPVLLLAVVSVAAAAVLRGLTGFGFALAAVPMLSFVMQPAQAVAVVIALQVMVGLRDLIAMRGTVDWPSFGRLTAGAVVGTPVGVALLSWLDPAAMRVAIAALVTIGLALLLRAPAAGAIPKTAAGALPAGALAGLFGGLAAMAGPPAIVWYMRSGKPPAVMRASLMVFFFAASVISAPMLAWKGMLDASTLVMAACGLPVLMIGTALGGRLFERTSETGYRRLALGVLAVMALASGLRGAAELLGS